MRSAAALCRHLTADRRTDGELLAAFVAGPCEDAFAELVRRHGPLVWGACRRLLPDPADAEDAFQATFLILVRRARGLTHAATLGPWLHRVAALTARGLRRKNARRLAHRAALTDHVPDPARPADTDLKADLDAALLALPAHYRDPIVLCHLQGFSRREAAERLGCPEGTLSAWLNRGLEKLRRRLSGFHPTPILTVATAGVPAALAASTARAAVATTVAAAGVPPTVSLLVEGVMHMFWVKKATAAAFALSAVFAMGIGAGLSTRTEYAAAGAQENGAPAPGVAPKATPTIEIAKEIAKEIASEMEQLIRAQQVLEEAIEAVQKPVLEKQQQLDAIKARYAVLRQKLANLQEEIPAEPAQIAEAIADLEEKVRNLEKRRLNLLTDMKAAELRSALTEKAGGSPKELRTDRLIVIGLRDEIETVTAQLKDAQERLARLKDIQAARQKAKPNNLKIASQSTDVAKPQDIDSDPEVVAQYQKMVQAQTQYEFRLNAAEDKNAPGVLRLKALYEEQKKKYEELKKNKTGARDSLQGEIARLTLERERFRQQAAEATAGLAETEVMLAYRQRMAADLAAAAERAKQIADLEAEVRNWEQKHEAAITGVRAAQQRYELTKKVLGANPKDLLDDQITLARHQVELEAVTTQLEVARDRLAKRKGIAVPAPAEYLELTISGKAGECEFVVREVPVDPKGITNSGTGPVTTRDPVMLAKLLARAKNAPNGPQQVVVIAQPPTSFTTGPSAALKACDAAGYKTVRFTGYVFGGGEAVQLNPDQKGNVPGYKRYDDAEVKPANLLKEIEDGMRRF